MDYLYQCLFCELFQEVVSKMIINHGFLEYYLRVMLSDRILVFIVSSFRLYIASIRSPTHSSSHEQGSHEYPKQVLSWLVCQSYHRFLYSFFFLQLCTVNINETNMDLSWPHFSHIIDAIKSFLLEKCYYDNKEFLQQVLL